MDALEFLPLMLKKAEYDRRGVARYRIWGPGGDVVEVDADSAAEAMSKSGISHPSRILNLDLYPDLSEAKPLLIESAPSIPTSIALEEVLPSFISADMLDSETPKPSFAEFSLGALVDQMQAAKKIPEAAIQLEAEPAPDDKKKPPAEKKRVTRVENAPSKENPGGDSIARPENALSEDDITRLLAKE